MEQSCSSPQLVHCWPIVLRTVEHRLPSITLHSECNTPPPSPCDSRREAGGITQEIRARTVSLQPSRGETEELADSPEAVAPSHQATVATFLDTPGQEIFYRMRTNGARVADAVLLVVSGEVLGVGFGVGVAGGVALHEQARRKTCGVSLGPNLYGTEGFLCGCNDTVVRPKISIQGTSDCCR